MISVEELKHILPQAYPFLMIDTIEEIKIGESLTAVKNITANEWPFSGGSRGQLYFPETLLIEAAAQAALVLYSQSKTHPSGAHPRYVIGKVQAEFFNTVSIGERVKIKVLKARMLADKGYAEVDIHTEKKIATVELFLGTREVS